MPRASKVVDVVGSKREVVNTWRVWSASADRSQKAGLYKKGKLYENGEFLKSLS